jgi:hypothetical protein
MKFMKNIFVIISICFLCSCNNSNKGETFSMSPKAYTSEEEECIRRMVYYGDTIAYRRMFDDFDDNSRIPEFLSYSLIMANKYDWAQAYYDVFYIFTSVPHVNAYECDTISFYCLDEKTREFALSYFRQAVYKGNYWASKHLLNEFGKGQEYPISELYLDTVLIKQAKHNLIK